MGASNYFNRKYPNRITRLKYEDLATDPIETSMYLYKVLGLTFTDSIRKYIIEITMSGRKDGCVVCPERGNSSEHVYEWKRELKQNVIEIISNICRPYLLEQDYL